MTSFRRTVVALLGCALIGFSVGPAVAAGSVVQVSLWDKGDTSMNMMGEVHPMGMIHEMVLAPIADTSTPLPYNGDEEKVDEDAAGHLGEVAGLEPGQSGALTVTMKPGSCILYCSVPGHYAMGMWTLLTVAG